MLKCYGVMEAHSFLNSLKMNKHWAILAEIRYATDVPPNQTRRDSDSL